MLLLLLLLFYNIILSLLLYIIKSENMYQVSCKRGLVLSIGIFISIYVCLYVIFYSFPNMSREEKEGRTKWWGVEGFLQALAPKYIDNILHQIEPLHLVIQ